MRTIGNGTIRRFSHGVSYGTGTSAKQLCDWRMVTNDDAATVQTAGHFNGLADVLQIGELIVATLDADGTCAARIYVVTANTGSAVTVAPISATAIA
jgi:hypothetical protein